jgi:ABC-2 type transport system permease protein
MEPMVAEMFRSQKSRQRSGQAEFRIQNKNFRWAKIGKLFKVWMMVASRAAQSQLLTSWAGVLFVIGKAVRFLLFLVFLMAVMGSAGSLAGYSREQVVWFFLVFNLVDIVVQLLFRGVYLFRARVVSGNYDLDLLKPWPSWFRPLFGWTDVLDLITLVPFVGLMVWYVVSNGLMAGVEGVVMFLLMFANALALGFGFHLFVCGVGILTTEIDHLVWVYRDLTSMARFPTDIYARGVRWVLTFTIPVVVLITVPAKAMLGLLAWKWVGVSLAVGVVFVWLSMRFWKFALSRYSSASS